MDETRDSIRCGCAFFACRVCRTKTGWPHQRWCELSGCLTPTCRDCRYWRQERNICGHPARRKEGERT